MNFIFIIGVEGAGHGMIRSVLYNFLQSPEVVDEGTWHFPLIKMCDNGIRPYEFYKNSIIANLETYINSTVKYLFDSASFPFGQPRDTMRRVDINLLIQILLTLKIKPKFLVLYRNPASCAYSGYRRKFGKILEQARIIEDNLNYIYCSLEPHPDYYRMLIFEHFLFNPKKYIKPLSEWLEIDKKYLENGIKNIKSTNEIPTDMKLFLKNFFNENRTMIWEYWALKNRIKASY